ncbi:ras-related protein Rab-26 [Acanthopagrus latus]|uniref:ras-related protein Rab-26 n=1 Tax=Acanthopagrus latus TaxID=8177 RepID=UPI00187C178B|nr:ras-related protein Rab-26 [Acanthopagrus latus]
MEDTRVARRQEEEEEEEEVRLVSSDSAYGSSAVDTDTEDGQTPTDTTWPYNEDITHKTILVGDSGVGKTSLLVQYDQGKFLPGSFTATVGIGFTG